MGLNKMSDESISNLKYLEKMPDNFPNLISIDLSLNNICDINSADNFKKFKNIRIINLFGFFIILGNPFCLS